MQIKLAESAGFCFGVDRAVKMVYDRLKQGKKVETFGPIIHNTQLVDDLKSKGVSEISSPAEHKEGYELVLRTHGVEKKVTDELKKENIKYTDAACPFVTKIHKIVSSDSDATVLIAGNADHPEVKGIRSYCHGKSYVYSNSGELANILFSDDFDPSQKIIAVSQTTFSIKEWNKCVSLLKKVCTNRKIFDTICFATEKRQTEARNLSKNCDLMIVIGGRHSSNTCKLRDVCSENAPTYLIETAKELSSVDFSKCNVVGVTAGASTPPAIIEEVLRSMSEENLEKEVTTSKEESAGKDAETETKAAQAHADDTSAGELSFEELLDRSEKETADNRGRVLKGIVSQITPQGVLVELPGNKLDGFIDNDNLSNEPFDSPSDIVKVGEEIEVVKLKTDEKEGFIKLSKKAADRFKGWDDIAAAYNDKSVLEGRIVKVVRGGVLASVKGTTVFIPGSLTGIPRNEDINTLLNTVAKFKIISIDEQRKRAKASIREVVDEERKAARDEIWSKLEIGQKYTGTVKSLTNYGAFVDIGGIDGMIHISELSWSRIKHPSEVVKVGDEVEVYIKDLKELDDGRKQVSLGFKKVEDNPWEILRRDYPVGTQVKVKIRSIASFGAFATIIPGIDGLIHVSQISWKRINSPTDVLKVGQEVDAVITEIDPDKRHVSLSIKQLLEKPEEKIAILDDGSDEKPDDGEAESKEASDDSAESNADAQESPEDNASAEPAESEDGEKPDEAEKTDEGDADAKE